MDEAQIIGTAAGDVVRGSGWFILNAGRAAWETMGPGSGTWCSFEADDARNEQVGIGIHVLWPGDSTGFYHLESNQEGFLVLSGRCLVIVESQERAMDPWDYFHCPPGTAHIILGAGDGPCAVLMMGRRAPDAELRYPVDATAARHGASVAAEAHSSKEAYAGLARTITRVPAPWPPG